MLGYLTVRYVSVSWLRPRTDFQGPGHDIHDLGGFAQISSRMGHAVPRQCKTQPAQLKYNQHPAA